MFYISEKGQVSDNTVTDTNVLYSPKQLSHHFLKLDETSGLAREVTINDNLHLLKAKSTTDGNCVYLNLKDMLFYNRINIAGDSSGNFAAQTAANFSRDRNNFFAYQEDSAHGNGAMKSFESPYKQYYMPLFVLIQDTESKYNTTDLQSYYLTQAKRLNFKDFTLKKLYTPITNQAYLNNLFTSVATALYTKYGIDAGITMSTTTAFMLKQIKQKSSYDVKYQVLGSKDVYFLQVYDTTTYSGCVILIDDENLKPLDQCFFKIGNFSDQNDEGLLKFRQHLIDVYNIDISNPFHPEFLPNGHFVNQAYWGIAGGGIVGEDMSNYKFYAGAITHDSYINYKMFDLDGGTDITGKINVFNMYDLILKCRSLPTVLTPINKLGCIVAANLYVDNASRYNTCCAQYAPVSNFLLHLSTNDYNGYLELDYSIYCGERSLKQLHTKRYQYTINDGTIPETLPDYTFIEGSGDSFNAICLSRGKTDLTITYPASENEVLYPMLIVKNPEIYRTPKNMFYDYNSIETIPYKTIYQNSQNCVYGAGTGANTAGGYTGMGVLQKGFSGHTILSNPDIYKATIDGTSNDTTTPFKDLEILKALNNQAAYDTTKTYANDDEIYITKPTTKISDWKYINYTHDQGIDAAADNILVDAQFDYFNRVFSGCSVYIVDTKIMESLNIAAPVYHKYMPNKCIWFEVNDLYTYTIDGKIEGYNPKYVSNTGTFIGHNLTLFEKFKARYFEGTVEVIWDNKTTAIRDFTVSGNLTLKSCDNAYEFYPAMWAPFHKAILRIENIKLNTEVAI